MEAALCLLLSFNLTQDSRMAARLENFTQGENMLKHVALKKGKNAWLNALTAKIIIVGHESTMHLCRCHTQSVFPFSCCYPWSGPVIVNLDS